MWSFINRIEPEQTVDPENLFTIFDKMIQTNMEKIYLDPSDNIHKRINDDGHRGPDFAKNIDILFSGCSQTYGQGVKDGTIWGELVAKELGLTYNNLSYRGGSVMQSIYNIFNYCEKYGNPKYILCMFPSFTRTHVFVDSKMLTSAPYDRILRERYGSDKGPYRAIQVSLESKYIKLPAQVEEVFPNEHRVWINLMFISMLETYCKSHNIKLLWTTWLDIYKNDDKLLYRKFKNFFKLSDNWNQTVYPNEKNLDYYNKCHQEIKNNYEDFFDRGTDWKLRDSEVWDGHWGAHTHVHVFEDFMKQIKMRGLYL